MPREYLRIGEGRTKTRRALTTRIHDAESGGSQSEIDLWRLMLDRGEVDTAAFLRNFKIPTEMDEEYVYFDLYAWQADILERAEKAWKQRRAAKFRIPKSRRRGVSSFFRAWFFERCLRVPGWKGVLIAP